MLTPMQQDIGPLMPLQGHKTDASSLFRGPSSKIAQLEADNSGEKQLIPQELFEQFTSATLKVKLLGGYADPCLRLVLNIQDSDQKLVPPEPRLDFHLHATSKDRRDQLTDVTITTGNDLKVFEDGQIIAEESGDPDDSTKKGSEPYLLVVFGTKGAVSKTMRPLKTSVLQQST